MKSRHLTGHAVDLVALDLRLDQERPDDELPWFVIEVE